MAFAPSVSAASTLPAYAHNDYRNARPLWDALDRGYGGVEVDVFLVDGTLLLGHDRQEATRGAPFEERYLRPLASRVQECGSVHGDGNRFLLNVELKEQDPAAFAELRRILEKYNASLTTVTDGVLSRGPIRVILVGWHPPLEQLLALPVRRFGIQLRSPRIADMNAECPAHLCQMISFEYRELSRWNGVGSPPRRFKERLQRFFLQRQRVPDRIIRVFEVPQSKAVYRKLLQSGVDYIGTKTIEDTRVFLERIEDSGKRHGWGRSVER